MLIKSYTKICTGKKNIAFTLAEVLITLAIIGIVASLTVPALKRNIDEQSNMTALKKFYREFNNATTLITYREGPPLYWGLYDNNDNSSAKVIDLYKEHLSMIKICSKDDASCFPFPVQNSKGETKITESNYRSWSMRGFVLRDGTSVCFDVNNNWFSVFFDVNGPKKPNKLGEDVFAWALNKDGKIVSIYDPSISDGAGQDREYDYAFVYMANGWKKP